MISIQNSYYFSLIVQFVSLGIFYTTTNIKTNPHQILLKNAYFLEYIVSIIEFIGYIILGYFINTKTNITTIRYLDWFVTTNMLLISLSFFLMFNNYYSPKNPSKLNTLSKLDFSYFKKNYTPVFINIWIFNSLMLLFGLLGELNYLNKYVSLILGLYCFFVSFYYIYSNFLGDVLINKIFISVFVFIWLLYAVAFMLDFENKNIAYNLLDLVSKNFFGIFLFYYIYNTF